MKKPVFLSAVLIALYLISCSKDGDSNGSDANMDLITKAAWKYDTAGIDNNNDGNIDMALPDGMVDDCERDNLITFKSDNTGTVDEGATKCDPSDPQTTSLTWQFKNNGTVLNIPDTLYGKFTGDADIKELTATRLKLRKAVQITDPITITVNVVIELKH